MIQRQAAIPLPVQPANDDGRLERRLPSGRSLVLRTDAGGEEIEIRSARGEVDLKITLTDAGPVVSLRGARLEIDSPDVAFRCRNFDVEATGDLSLRSQREVRILGDELRARTEHDIHLNGAYVRINCTDDLQVPVQLPLPALDTIAAPPSAAECGCSDPATSDPHPAHKP
jgi:hypothetical protein